MCQNYKYVHNKYLHKSILVPCGKCKSCQQQKANFRAMRIRNHYDGKLCLFVTLTYDNRFVPYIETHRLVNISPYTGCFNVPDDEKYRIPVYRDFTYRSYRGKDIIKPSRQLLTQFHTSEFVPYCYSVPELNKKSSCTGVVYWPDVQNFLKRLRTDLKRDLKYEKSISYFAVGELGSHTFRPHFHLLIFFEGVTKEEVRPFIIKAWPFGDMLRKDKRIQIARDASSYVSSYLNKSANLPIIFKSKAIRQKHSHSLYFGNNLPAFSLSSLLEKVDKRNLSYGCTVYKDGVPCVVDLPIPKYVINRYFPKFKGYSSFSPSEVLQLLRVPSYLWYKLGDFSRYSSKMISSELLYSKDDFRKFVVHLRHCIDYYIKVTGKTIYDYAIDYNRVWFERFNFCFKHSFDDIGTLLDFLDFYENSLDYVIHPNRFSLSLPLPSSVSYTIDPNQRSFIVRSSNNLVDIYDKKEKLFEINNISLSEMDDEF